MNEIFFEYHMNEKEFYNNMLSNSLIVLDTNSLLNLYRYSLGTRPKFFEILRTVSDRLILPHQVGSEFYKNREKIIQSKASFVEKFTEFLKIEINALSDKIKNSNTSGQYASTLSLLKYEETLKNTLIEKLDAITIDLTDCIKQYNNDISYNFIFEEDSILKELLDLYRGKVCDKLSEEQLQNIYAEGQKRYDDETPPGYKDNKKAVPDKFGDLIIWNEMIEISKKNSKNILFISDDRKDDWCHKFEGKDLGPRRELIREFFNKTGNYFYSITPFDFIKNISEMNKIDSVQSLEKETKAIQETFFYDEKNNKQSDRNQDSIEYNYSIDVLDDKRFEKIRNIILNSTDLNNHYTPLYEKAVLNSKLNFLNKLNRNEEYINYIDYLLNKKSELEQNKTDEPEE